MEISQSSEPQEELPVELMSSGDVSAWSLNWLYDAKTGDYNILAPPEMHKNLIKTLYLTNPGASAEKFDAAWPRTWLLTEAVYTDASGLTAFLDTGVLANHPLLKDCIRDVVDFTGEGGEDQVGHGTMAALIARMVMPGVPKKKFLILKCIGANGKGSQENLIAALRWMQKYNAANSVRITQASMSLGVYNKKLGLFDCDGTCRLCTTALEVSKDILLEVAAGNLAGRTACPARAAFLPSHPNIYAIARPEEATSGKGTIAMNSGSTFQKITLQKLQ